MSVKAMTWVWDNSPTAGTERLVLLAIADTADDNGGNAWPSIPTLARKTRLDVRTVQRVIRRLVGADQLRVDTAAGRAGTNVYTLVLDQQDRSGLDPGDNSFSAGATPWRPATPGTPPGVSSAPPLPRHLHHHPPGARTTRTFLNVPERPPPPARASAALVQPGNPGAGLGEECGRTELLAALGVDDLSELALRVRQTREVVGLSTTLWSERCLFDALNRAVLARGWPAERAVDALLAVAGDKASRGPMRLAEAGPWWDSDPTPHKDAVHLELTELETRLSDLGGRRVLLQRQARQELAREGLPVNRLTVARRACQVQEAPTTDSHHISTKGSLS